MEFTAPVDAYVKNIARIKFQIDPRAAVGNHPRRIEQFAAGVGFPLVVFEKNAGRTVQLAYDHPLGPVDHERAVGGHQRNLAEIDFLLLDVLNAARTRLAIDVPEHELDRYL